MSDALSCWFLRKWEQKEEPWWPLIKMGIDGSFEEFVRDWRENDGLRNDDVTLTRIDVR